MTGTEFSDDGILAAREFWVFAYGSLIWRPGFDFAERQLAHLLGFRRRFCMTSIHYRGTPEVPGLVLSLDADPAGRCDGIAYRIDAPDSPRVLAYLRERELVSYAYEERRVPLALADGRSVQALAYVSNPAHPQYCGGLDLAQQAAMIARAVGSMGPNTDYLRATVESLETLGLHDPDLAALVAMLPEALPRPVPAEGAGDLTPTEDP